MKDQSFSYRIVKIGGKAVSVALTAFGLMTGAAQADNVWLGTQYSSVTGYMNSANLFLAETGAASTAQHYENGADAWNCGSCDSWSASQSGNTNANTAYSISQSRGGDVYYQSTVIYSVVTNQPDELLYTNKSIAESKYYVIDGDLGLTSTANRVGNYQENKFYSIVDATSGQKYYFGTGAEINAVSRGHNAFSTGVSVDGNGSNQEWFWVNFGYNEGAVGGADQTHAINIAGDAYFAGNNTVNGSATANSFTIHGDGSTFNGEVVATAAVTVNGNNNTFNSTVTADKVDLYGDKTTFAGDVTVANGLNFKNGVSASLTNGSGITGNVNMGSNDATLTLSNGSQVTGDVTGTGTDNGTLVFEKSGVVTGTVGTIKNINVLGNKALVQLNTSSGDTTVNALNITADQAAVEVYGKLTGNVRMNGHFSKLELLDRNGTAAGGANGMNGTLDFGMYKSNLALLAPDTYGKGTLEVGHNVNVKFSDDPTSGIKLTNADNATVVFAGSSVVTGNLGSAAGEGKHNTPYKIYAGSDTSTVTFNGHVYVGAGNLNVGPSNTTVKLNGVADDSVALTGNLVFGTGTPTSVEGSAYSTYGDAGINGTWGNAGTVELADGKNITGSITTVANGTGIMKFMGASMYGNSIGTSGLKLASVTFNAATAGTAVAPVQVTITGDVWANQVTIGNGLAYTNATLTAGSHQLGDGLTLAGANTTLNMLGATTTQNADGTLSNAGVSTATVGNSGIATHDATLRFAVDAGNVAARTGAIVQPANGIITTTGDLTMNGNEKVSVTLLGSMRNNQSIKLIDAAGGNATTAASLSDNSFVIDTIVTRNSGDLVLTASRASDVYVTKSATTGHFSNAAALRLGTLAANGDSINNPGRNYTSDMQTVFNKLDLNQWGYGNNEANLANQVKRLAPISNGSITQSALDAGMLALNTMGNRMASLRADKNLVGIDTAETEGRDGQWVKLVGNSSKQNAKGAYDGYSARTSGMVWGTDTRLNKDALLGMGLSVTNTSVEQADFRAGQSSTIRSYELAGYGAYQFSEQFYGEGSVSYARHNITGSRLTAIDRMAKADYNADQLTARLGIGYRFVLDDKQTLTPMFNLESSRLSSDTYTETGADALSLKLNEQKVTRNRASLGLRYLSENSTAAGTVYRPELSAAIYRDNKGLPQNTTAAFAGDLTGNTFNTTGMEVARSGYNLAAGVSILNSKTSLVQLHYGYDHREGFRSHSARIKVRWDF